ncbi:MAG: PBP1A family penicillin-binding protein [Acidobacteriales bacterium]|nr:PBP1A family penicillin-binding protein [Terriglobales bacterium]
MPRGRKGHFHLSDPLVRAALATFLVLAVGFFSAFAYFYIKYEKLIDQRMAGPIFANASKIFATPRVVAPGYKATREGIAGWMRAAGYTDAKDENGSRLGTYRLVSGGVEIRPGPESFANDAGALVRVEDGAISQISSLGRGGNLSSYTLEPVLVTGLFDAEQRAKRRIVTYDEIPPQLVQAVIAIEDRRFFQHSGINYWRFAQAALRNIESGRRAEGGSTLTMQIARGFFLTPEKKISRKLAEMMIAIQLEQRYAKQQIFEFYANHVNLGQRGSFAINGLGEAARAYFGKDIRDLDLAECALLAAMIQRPNYLSPYKHAERALARRNLVLEGMLEIGAITQEQEEKAKAMPLKLAPPNVEASEAPYFVDLVKDTLLDQFSEDQLNQGGLRVYTTLDPDLQKAASEAIDIGMKEVDDIVKKMRTRRVKGANGKVETKVLPGPIPQVALVAIDPDTGQVRALVGGRNYGFSQLDHAVAKRPTGSIFKPFVYAAAVNNALTGEQPVFTAVTPVDNTPTSFYYEDKVYEPRNYGDKYNEVVTTRFALEHSLNNATVRIAEQVGYAKVAQLAKDAGIASVQATPALALGSYDATPLDMAGAYTVFANGARSTPLMITSVRNVKGEVVQNYRTTRKPVLDPRVAYVMTNMMEAVICCGTAAGVRARGFDAPAAGKTGTSRDAWFAGYTTNLLTIVWVGFDDYSDLGIEGAKSAAPIWAEFMKRAVKLPAYRNTSSFTQPPGVVNLTLDKVTNRVATGGCPDDYDAAFIAGTEPRETCDQSPIVGFFKKIFGGDDGHKEPDVVSNRGEQHSSPPLETARADGTAQPARPKDQKKKGFFGRLFGVFSDDRDKKKQTKPPGPEPVAKKP